MTPRLLAFVRLLREQGLRVSVAESLEALQSIGHVGLDDRELLRLSLRTVLVKSQRDFALFDTLFQRFFTVPRRRKRRRDKHQHQSGNEAGKRPAPHAGHNGGLPSSLPSLRALHQSKGQPSVEPLEVQTQARLDALERAWQQQLKAPLGPVVVQTEKTGVQALQTRIDRPFPPDRLEDMYHQVERLAVQLLTRRALRYRRARHGRVDMRGTVLRGLRSGTEIPFTLLHRRRKHTKLRLMVLCDVSGSVWQVSHVSAEAGSHPAGRVQPGAQPGVRQQHRRGDRPVPPHALSPGSQDPASVPEPQPLRIQRLWARLLPVSTAITWMN